MTDTDKLKRAAEAAEPHWYDVDIVLRGDPILAGTVGSYIASFRPKTTLELIAQRDEAVALLREFTIAGDKRKDMWGAVFAFLARINKETE